MFNLGIGFLLKRAFSAIVTRKRIIGWIAAVVLAVTALVSGVSIEELKAGIADAPKLDLGAAATSENTEVK